MTGSFSAPYVIVKVAINVYNINKNINIGDIVEYNRIINCYVDRKVGIIGEEEMQRYSIIIPLVQDNNELKILFEVRAKTLRNQPGEISFPGGKIENNEDSKSASIRETCEELGILEDNLEIVGAENILITQHNRIIYPYIARIIDPTKIKPSSFEVDHVFLVPINYLINYRPLIKSVKIITEPTEDFPYEDIVNGRNYKWFEGKNDIYFYKFMDYTIWGLTARILTQFIKTISETERKK
jgi:peroxisomal coenzyme A diphosphatase NUDT7